MQNPWADLPSTPPYVLPADRAAVDAFQAKAKPEHALHLELLPEPFLGRPDAPLVLLQANPGFHTDDWRWHEKGPFANRARLSLEHRFGEFPFHVLDPAHPSPANKWWTKRLKPLRLPPAELAKRVACVELHGYHSKKYHAKLQVPSQQYGFALVRQALDRGAVVVLVRCVREWTAAVPELAGHPRVFALNSPQNATLSRNNCPDGFDAILAAVARPLSGAVR